MTIVDLFLRKAPTQKCVPRPGFLTIQTRTKYALLQQFKSRQKVENQGFENQAQLITG